MNIQEILIKIKKEFDEAITTAVFNGNEYLNGNKAKEALIRSQKIINYIYEYIKDDFIQNGIDASKIFPHNGIHEINKYLAHITKTRIEIDSPGWDWLQIKENINTAFRKFLDRLDDSIFPSDKNRNKSNFILLMNLLETSKVIIISTDSNF